MSIDYSVNLTLYATYNEENILKILQKGSSLGWIFYDQILGELYEEAPILNAEQALQKILRAIKEDIEGGPTVYVKFANPGYAHLSFLEENKFLRCDLFGISYLRRKDFEENFHGIDFAFYIKLMLDLCNNFLLKKIEIDEY